MVVSKSDLTERTMLRSFKKIILSVFIMALLPSLFYAADEPGGGDVPEYVEQEQIPDQSGQRVNIISYPEPTEEERIYLIRLSKPKFLTFNCAIGTGEQTEMEFGIRFSFYFRETAESFNIGLIFGANYLYGRHEKGRDDPYTPGKRHYFSTNAMAAVYIYGFHLAVGLDYSVKFKGPDSDAVFLNTVFYKKSYFSLDIEIGYLFMPKSNRFTVLLAGVVKGQLGSGSYENQFPTHSDAHVKGIMCLFRVQIGLFLF